METFLAVAEERSFSRAAARLHRTQPAVSQAIAKLEGELGEVLFERSSRDGTLTDAGEVLREYAAKLLNLRNDASGALTELRELHRGRLNLAANEYTCLYLLPSAGRVPAAESADQTGGAADAGEPDLGRGADALGRAGGAVVSAG